MLCNNINCSLNKCTNWSSSSYFRFAHHLFQDTPTRLLRDRSPLPTCPPSSGDTTILWNVSDCQEACWAIQKLQQSTSKITRHSQVLSGPWWTDLCSMSESQYCRSLDSEVKFYSMVWFQTVPFYYDKLFVKLSAGTGTHPHTIPPPPFT
jgi:hypothetical protein